MEKEEVIKTRVAIEWFFCELVFSVVSTDDKRGNF